MSVSFNAPAASDPTGFRPTAAALFARLGLSPPRFDATGIVRLLIDNQGVNLSDDGRGYMLVETVAGRAPEDGAARRSWRAAVLRGAPGWFLLNEAGVFVRRQGQAETLVVHARYPLRRGRLERLERLIEDVTTQADHYRSMLDGLPASGTRSGTVVPESDVMIFRL
ncbi:hypothetical protein [Aureimonas sp. AU4]|uniref:hypothetical protein n=1 Tax=Aureimonas sp. AU4 TaxID=1638163 RepID=UPI00078668CB|nr:hypothetical protein [Aureimonas sp. AU4]